MPKQEKDEAIAQIQMLRQERDQAVARCRTLNQENEQLQAQVLRQERDQGAAQIQMLRRERDQAVAQAQTLKQENDQLQTMMSLTRSRLNEILVLGSGSSNQPEEDEDTLEPPAEGSPATPVRDLAP